MQGWPPLKRATTFLLAPQSTDCAQRITDCPYELRIAHRKDGRVGEAARQDADLAHDLLHHEAQVQRKGLVVAHKQHRPRGRQRPQAALNAAVLGRGEEHRARQPLDGRCEGPGRNKVNLPT